MGQTGYGRIDNNLFIFMNIGIPGVDGMDYKNHYDPRTESVSWCAKKKTHSGQEQMQKIINGDLDLYLFARWERDEDWTYLGEAHVLSYEDNMLVADQEGNETFCMEYQLTCKGIEEDHLDYHGDFELYKLSKEKILLSKDSISCEMNPYKLFEWITRMKAEKIEFKNLPFRFQMISNNIINDSKSTNCESTIAALNTLEKDIILIIGGSHKIIDYKYLSEEINQRVKKII